MGESASRTKPEFGYRAITSLGISSREASERYGRLQEKLVPLWKSISSLNQEEQTIIVVPSMSMPDSDLGSMELAYEERFLFLLLLLRQPKARLIYITAMPVQRAIIDYYLGLLPGVILDHARKRLFLLSPCDGSSRPLTEKILERPRFIQKIRQTVIDPNRAHIVPFNTTILERDLALRLGIPMYGADPKYFPLGSKSGCRQLFKEEGVPHALGYENLTTIGQVVEAICNIRAQKEVPRVILKLNEGVSGEGNAQVDLKGLPTPGSAQEPDAVAGKLRRMQMESANINFKTYVEKLAHRGGIVEEMLQAEEVRSPSVQMRVTPLGDLQILSTHDQLLGGRGGQSYLGAKFPADKSYAVTISHEAAKVGRRLAKEGVIGRFAVDFLVVRSKGSDWTPYAIELNLRKGGTTHPFLTLQFLTDGVYDPETANFLSPSGAQKCLVASDHVKSPMYKSLNVEDLLDLAVRENLHFDQTRQTGVVFHMMRALPEHGRTGLTAIANSHEDAYALYERATSAITREAEAALQDPGLPE